MWNYELNAAVILLPLPVHPVPLMHQAPVVQTSDSAIHRINHYPADSVIDFRDTYLQDSDLSGGQRYPTFEQPGPDLQRCKIIYCPHPVGSTEGPEDDFEKENPVYDF